MDYNNPPESSKTVVSVNGVPLGTYDNLLCITGGEGTGKSIFVSALIAGTLADAHKTSTRLALKFHQTTLIRPCCTMILSSLSFSYSRI